MQKYTLLLSRRNATDFLALGGLIVRLPGEIVRISGRERCRLLLIHSFRLVRITRLSLEHAGKKWLPSDKRYHPQLSVFSLLSRHFATRRKQYSCRFLNLTIPLSLPTPFVLSPSWHSHRVTVIDHAGLNPREAYVISGAPAGRSIEDVTVVVATRNYQMQFVAERGKKSAKKVNAKSDRKWQKSK